MKLYTLLTPALLAFVSASAINQSKRQLITADTLNQDVLNIHNAVLANQAATSNYNSGDPVTGLVEGTPVLATVGAIHVVNRKGFADANLSGPVNQADTNRIVTTVENTVGVSIPKAVDILVSKKPNFVASGQQQVTIASLQLLLNDHDTFSAALVAKTYKGDATLNQRTTAVVDKIHNAIQSGINVYST